MKNVLKFLVALLVISLIGIALVYVFAPAKDTAQKEKATESGDVAGATTESSGRTNTGENNSYVQKLAQHLVDSGMILYGAFWDQSTIDQKQLFGDSATLLDYVECDQTGSNPNPDECLAQGITIYPTWVYQGKQYHHLQSLANLAEMSGFSE